MEKVCCKFYRIFVGCVVMFIAVSCGNRVDDNVFFDEVPVARRILEDQSSVYFGDYEEYPEDLSLLPIGMFDSGTGGLTVLEQFLDVDFFDNVTGEEKPDGVPDFETENFIYLADQANMPYGLYDSEDATDYLRELIVKDALFLTTEPNRTKFIVIACNTATAYGLEDVRKLLEFSGSGVKVIGVIEAGALGALESVVNSEGYKGIGVLATVGTVESGGYEREIMKIAQENGFAEGVKVVSQGGLGFAEAVDMDSDFINPLSDQVRSQYRGPSYGVDEGIDENLIDLYNFDYASNSMLVERDESGAIKEMQINSAGNYARFHMVSLIEKFRAEHGDEGAVLKSVIMGCTHYPYLRDTLERVVEEMRNYKKGGTYVYRDVIDDSITFVDPAVNTAKSAYRMLRSASLLNGMGANNMLQAFISVPDKSLPDSLLDDNGNLAYKFKYGREIDSDFTSVSVVPFSKENINPDNMKRIKERLPLSYELINRNVQ
jgi:glutamate racemase